MAATLAEIRRKISYFPHLTMRPHGTFYRTHYIAQVLLPGAPVTSADDWAERFSVLTPD